MIASRVMGIGSYVPPNAVKNQDLEKMLDTSHDWIVQRTGIEQRHWADANTATSDLCLPACLEAVSDAKIDKSEIDLVILATSTPDHDIPGGAPFLQAKLGIPEVPFIEIRQACSGFVYALDIADKYIRTESAKCVLIIGAELQSKVLEKNPNGRAVSVIFADGAGAMILKPTVVKDPSKDPHVMSSRIHMDGSFAKELWISSPGSGNGAERISQEDLAKGKHYLQMNGRLVFMHAVTRMPQVLLAACEKAKVAIADIDMFFFHQANMRISEKITADMKIAPEKVHSTIHKYGNTTAATIPLGISDAKNAGKLKPGMLIAMSAFGAGFTWGAAVIRL